MKRDLAVAWKAQFEQLTRQHEYTKPLQQAFLTGLGDWTQALTHAVVSTCQVLGWHAAAKNHGGLLPVQRFEYLSLDVMAFSTASSGWHYPTAVFELENNADEYIAYSLWKVLCVQAQLRVVFCYRQDPGQAGGLIQFLRDNVVRTVDGERGTSVQGEVVVVVGSRGKSSTFPYGFFRWWQWESNTSSFRVLN